VSQDPLGVQGIRVSPAAPNGVECWARPLADGAVAALLLNRRPVAAAPVCTWAQLGLPPSAQADVRDLWARSDLGKFTSQYSVTVPSHGSALVKVTPS
jgi:alpha-galactosidase